MRGAVLPDPRGARRRRHAVLASRIMDPKLRSIPEAGAYRMVQMALHDLEAAARILDRLQAVATDPDRAVDLETVRAAIRELRTVVPPAPAADA
jgi:hypothetical protein